MLFTGERQRQRRWSLLHGWKVEPRSDPALLASLEDENSYVQRHALDIVTSNFPLDDQFLTGNPGLRLDGEKSRLISACLKIVLKRDLSLNRRVFAWLTAPKGGEKSLEYFRSFAFQVHQTDSTAYVGHPGRNVFGRARWGLPRLSSVSP